MVFSLCLTDVLLMNRYSSLPAPDPQALAHSRALCDKIAARISAAGGWLPFAEYMNMALYTPEYGYYSGGANPFGRQGDFVTAPTLTPLFGETLARQIEPLLRQTAGNLYEFGAGTGQLAASLLARLPEKDWQHYYIIEVSAELAQRQQRYLTQHLPQQAHKIVHLTELPPCFDGIIIGNEVLDAMPISVYRREHNQVNAMGVTWRDQTLQWQARAETDVAKQHAVLHTFPEVGGGYQSELHPQQYAFVSTLAQKLTRGAMIWLDYGYDAAQYYHPQRTQGTLIGHYHHHVVHDVFSYPGLTDLTAHVNFTRIADAGVDAGLDLIGYTTQAYFLLNLGITDLLANTGTTTSEAYIRAAAACHLLLDQHEMGELFKVMAFGKNIDVDWQGFSTGDICHKL